MQGDILPYFCNQVNALINKPKNGIILGYFRTKFMLRVNKNKEQIEKLKKLVNEAEFLFIPEKKKWLEMADTLTLADLQEAIRHFNQATTDLEDKKLKIIKKAGLGDEYMEQIKKLANSYKKETIQKEEKHLRKTTENPEDVLKKLDNL